MHSEGCWIIHNWNCLTFDIKEKQSDKNNADGGGWNKAVLSKLFWESLDLIIEIDL